MPELQRIPHHQPKKDPSQPMGERAVLAIDETDVPEFAVIESTQTVAELNQYSIEEMMQIIIHQQEMISELDRALYKTTLEGKKDKSQIEAQKREIEKINKAYAEAIKQGRIDPLTGIDNRRSYDEVLEKEVSRSIRHTASLSIAMIDIDHFKKFNDEHGHHIGDEALKNVAGILKKVTRKEDFVARWGGEEFVVMLPETDADSAARAISKLVEAVKNETKDLPYGPITISAGIADLCLENEMDGSQLFTAEQIQKGADIALYQSKEKGRNRATKYEPSMGKPNQVEEKVVAKGTEEGIVELSPQKTTEEVSEPKEQMEDLKAEMAILERATAHLKPEERAKLFRSMAEKEEGSIPHQRTGTEG